VYLACTVDVPVMAEEPQFMIYPNPAEKMVYILAGNKATITEVIINNQLGQNIWHGGPITNPVDVSGFQRGIYIIEIATDQAMIKQKLIIQ